MDKLKKNIVFLIRITLCILGMFFLFMYLKGVYFDGIKFKIDKNIIYILCTFIAVGVLPVESIIKALSLYIKRK